MEIQLLRPSLPSAPSAAPASPGARARPRPARPSPTEPSLPSAPLAAPPGRQAAEGASDCAPEDLPLLSDDEKARCRNQIDADQQRRLARGADERAAKEIVEAKRGPQTYRMDADKEAEFEAVAQPHAQQGPHLPMVGPGIDCQHVTFPLLSGVETNPNLFAKKHKQEHRPRHGSSSCSAGL